jgi:CCR4-NOT transcriptional complex subunit CAF120
MSNFSNRDSVNSKTTLSPPSDTIPFPAFPEKQMQQQQQQAQDVYRASSPQRGPQQPSNITGSPTRREQVQRNRASSRPMSMVQTYQPPLMELSQDTLPELQPVFAYLNSHGNKLYQEGYFLKLDDQNSSMLLISPEGFGIEC